MLNFVHQVKTKQTMGILIACDLARQIITKTLVLEICALGYSFTGSRKLRH
jgi:hypothetical protein